MTAYAAFTWTLVHPEPSELEISSSQYLLIDRLVLNIEVAPSGDVRAVAALKDAHENARDVALRFWIPEDERRGLRLNGGVRVACVEVDLEEIAVSYDYWSPIQPTLAAVLERVKAGALL